MFNILIRSLILVFIFTSSVNAETVNKIEVSGNQRISDQTILVLGNIDKNENFSDDYINNILKNLYNSNFFKDVNISVSSGLLNIEVIENPIIENIEFTGIKNKTLIKNISEAIVLQNRMSFSENQLEKDIIFIKNVLKSNGFYFVKVQPTIELNKEINSVRLYINIDQGNKAKIKEIRFIGDKKIKDKKLLEVIASEEHKFWKFVSNKVYLSQTLVNLDKRLLENYYKNLGYYKVKVLSSFAEFNNEGYFKLIFNIDSGNKYYFNDLKLNLPADYNEPDFTKLEKKFQKLKGKKYSIDDLDLILQEIDKIASSRLYDFIDATVDEKIIDKNKINLTFNVIDSEKFYVERINVLGNYNTIEEVVRNKLVVDEGDPLNTLLYNKSIDNIKSLGIFKTVDAEIIDGSNESLKVVNISVEEKPTGEIALAAGFGTAGGSIGGGLKEKNFLGRGINLNTNIEFSEDSIKGQFIYSKPNFAYTDNTLFTSVKSQTTDNLTNFGYKQSDIGFSIGTRFEQYENVFFSPEVDFSFEEIETNSTASASRKKQEGNYEDFYFNYGLRYDLRNSSYKPTAGSNTYFYQELPIVSGNNEIGNTFVYTKYKSLNDASDMVGKASFYFKAINSIDGSDVRISKRGQVPYHRLRGFEKGKVGPKDNSDFIGGNYISTLNLSTNLPTILRNVENVDFTYFIDIANIWGVDYDSSIDDSNIIRSSTGVGLDLLTPIGPLSFSLSQPITKKSSDHTETFRFNIGTTF